MQREESSHKGDNGKVAVIGGSRTIHGAPLLSALAAEASGVDLIYVCLPACHEEVAKSTALNFQVHPFQSHTLIPNDVEAILELLATMDTAVIGPGLDRGKLTIDALEEIIDGASCQLVLDATALQPSTLDLVRGKHAVLTPHLGELERMELSENDLEKAAKDAGVVITLKGKMDRIAGPDGETKTVEGGNAGLTVGGTGDALAGLIAGLIAQKMDPMDAAMMACRVIKRAGTVLLATKGYAYTATDVIGEIPHLLNAYEDHD